MISILFGLIICSFGLFLLIMGLAWFYPVIVEWLIGEGDYAEFLEIRSAGTNISHLFSSCIVYSGLVLIVIGCALVIEGWLC